MSFSSLDARALPGAYLLHITEMMAPWRIPVDALLADVGLGRERLTDPACRVSLETTNALLLRAIEMTGEPALGLLLGTRMRPSQHGYIGFAAMTASTVGEAIRIAERYAPLRTAAFGLRLRVEGPQAALYLVFDTDLEPLRQSVLLALCMGLFQMSQAATGHALHGRAELDFPAPAWLERVGSLLEGHRLAFGQPANRLVFPASDLELPLLMADPVATQLALSQCERDLESLGEQARLVGRVRRLLEDSHDGFPGLDSTAAVLHLSPRTLKRHLALQGTSFSELLEEVRREKALLLLRNRSLAVAQVADRLGYTDVANFTRAFRRWTGMTPSGYRDHRDAQ